MPARALRPFLRFLTVTWLLLGAASAQITVPTLGTRGEVPASLVETVTAGLRAGLVEAGYDVRPGELITPGIAGSLEPEFTRLIGEIDGSAYAVSGEVAAAGRDAVEPWLVNVIAVEVASGRATDLLSRPLAGDGALVGLQLAREIAAFARPLARLPEGDAGLFVTTEPRGARIAVDGVPVGATPDVGPLMLAPGRYRVELRADGFLPETRSVELRAGETRFVHVVLTAISGGSIRVQARPEARVELDGEAVGRTPLTVPALPGRHVLVVERDGFAPERIEVPVRTYRVTRVDAELTALHEPMLFWAEERGTVVRIDGAIQTGGWAEDLEPGLRRIELIRPGGRSEVLRAIPERGVFELDLETGELREVAAAR
jgi:hypothetical protein